MNLLELSLAVCASWLRLRAATSFAAAAESPFAPLALTSRLLITEDASAEILQEFARKAQQDSLVALWHWFPWVHLSFDRMERKTIRC